MTVTISVESSPSASALRLRPWCSTDLPALLAAHGDPSLRWASARLTAAITDEADAHRWLATQHDGWIGGTRYSFAILETEEAGDDATLVGNVSIKGLTAGGTSAEVGYWTSAFARGRGIAPRALDAVSQWAFALDRETPLTQLELFHRRDNLASCRVGQKAMFPLCSIMPAQPPEFPVDGHLHIRYAELRLPNQPARHPLG